MRKICAKVRIAMSMVIDGEATESVKKWCEAHLRECIACRAEWNALHAIREAMHSHSGAVKAPVDVYESIAPKLDEIESLMTARNGLQRRWMAFGFAFALSILLAVCWLGVKTKQMSFQDVAYGELSPIYLHAHVLGAEEAQLLPNPVVNISIVEVARAE